MEDPFFFSLVRISTAQILKASGFDKCKPLVLNAVAELYIKHLELVLRSAMKFAQTRTSCANQIATTDVLQALLEVGLIKEPGLITEFDLVLADDKNSTKSFNSFLQWLKHSDSYATSKKLSEVPSSLLYNLIEKRRVDTSAESDQERKKRRLKERQEFYNQLKQGEDSAQFSTVDGYMDDLDDDELTAMDKLSWLTYLAEKDIKLGHNHKFVNSSIQDSLMEVHKNKRYHPTSKDGLDSYSVFREHIHNNTRNDHVVIQINESEDPSATDVVVPSTELKNALPYNITYDSRLLDDSLDQYIEYAAAHKEEIETNLESVQIDHFEKNKNFDGIDEETIEDAKPAESLELKPSDGSEDSEKKPTSENTDSLEKTNESGKNLEDETGEKADSENVKDAGEMSNSADEPGCAETSKRQKLTQSSEPAESGSMEEKKSTLSESLKASNELKSGADNPVENETQNDVQRANSE